jgi:methyltransferase
MDLKATADSLFVYIYTQFIAQNWMFYGFILFIIVQRLSELFVNKRNEKWLLQQGAVQYGQAHYPFMIALHTLFIVSLVVEYVLRGGAQISYSLLTIYFLILVFKCYTLAAIGKYWSTKIYRIPGLSPVLKGPYKYFKHPNYTEVVLEIGVIPLIFHLYITAIIFTILNAWMLYVRIKEENKVWA